MRSARADLPVDGPGSISSYQHVGFRWDIAIQPKGPVSRAARVNPDGFQIVSHSPHKEEAWLWIRQLTGSVESQMELARISGRMPSLREAMIRYTRMTGITMPDNWQALIETAFDPDGYAAYVVPNATEIDAVVNPVMSRIWNGQIAPAVGLQQIHDVLSVVASDYLRLTTSHGDRAYQARSFFSSPPQKAGIRRQRIVKDGTEL